MAADHNAHQLALRNRLLALVVATTGSMSLSATADGFARVAGSFVTDGFQPGMEILAAGFGTPVDGYHVVLEVSATLLTIDGGLSAVAAAGGRTLVAGLPEKQGWENVHLEPEAGRPYLEEDYVPARTEQLTAPVLGATVDEHGLWILRWYFLGNRGVAAIRDTVKAVLDLFYPGWSTTVGSEQLRITGGRQGEIGPFAGPARNEKDGWSVVTITVPWRITTTNPTS